MASGQKLLADLLGITSSATDSLWSSKLLKEIKEEEGNDVFDKSQFDTKKHSELDEAENVIISVIDEALSSTNEGRVKTEKSLKTDDIPHKDISYTRMHLVPLGGDVYDQSRCLEAKVLIEKDNSCDASHGSQIETPSSSSSERLPTPDPSDFIKSGVFVSSGQNAISSVFSHSKGSTSNEKEGENSIHLQQDETLDRDRQIVAKKKSCKAEEEMQIQKRSEEHQLMHSSEKYLEGHLAPSGLKQGKESENTSDFDTLRKEDEGVIILRCPEGQKKTVIQERFKKRMQNSVPVKKIAIPRLVKQNQGDSERMKVESDPAEKGEKRSLSSAPADEAVSYAAVATSTAIAPFVQIQNALENQISSLVDTMNRAHTAEKQFSVNSQEHGLKDLESKILELIDRKLQPSKIQDQQEKADDILAGEGRIAQGQLGRNRTQEKSQHGMSDINSDLQLIPTRDYGDFKRSSSPLNRILPQSAHAPLFPVPQLLHRDHIKFQAEHSVPPRSNPVAVKYYDKSTSPKSVFKRYLTNANTQTSSSESSLLSEKSILDTPLPRSKIPVPFSRYTPKRDVDSRHSKWISSRNRSGPSQLEKPHKDRKQMELLEKENRPPKSPEPNQSQTPVRLNENMKAYNYKELIRPLVNETFVEKVKEETKPMSGTEIIAPIDRYLCYPLRAQLINPSGDQGSVKQIPAKHTNPSVAAEQEGTHHTSSQTVLDEESSRGNYIAAGRILSEIQQRRKRLENNIGAILRQKDEQRLYEYLDQHENVQSDESNRIRRRVDAKIREISSQLKKELYEAPGDQDVSKQGVESKRKEVQKQPLKDFQKGKIERFAKSAQAKTGKLKKTTEKKEKTKRKRSTNAEASPIPKPPGTQKPSKYNPAILASIIGEQFYKPHRSTVRPPYIQFHSPPKTLPRDGEKKIQSIKQEETPKLSHSKRSDFNSPKYYFQPTEPVFPKPSDSIRYPARGELVPVAKPLGKPRQDERLRLPIPSEKLLRNEITKSNTALLEIKSDLPDKDDTKKTKNLGIQTLPSVDIQGELEQKDDDREAPITNIALNSPKIEDYEDFQDYIVCVDVDENEDEEGNSDIALEFKGAEDIEPKEYPEPRFPPQHPCNEVEQEGARIKCKTSVEQRTHEWLEQQLLARIVAQMSIPQDPTIMTQESQDEQTNDSNDSNTDEEESEGDWTHDVFGAAGVQLCIDAGIPLNKDLIMHLVEDVVTEKVRSMLGHPKRPQTALKEVSESNRSSFDGPQNLLTPMQTPDYTPLPSEASLVHTPLSVSTSTEVSDNETILQVGDKIVADRREEEPVAAYKLDNFIKVSTPPRSPDISKASVTVRENIDTPLSSIREEEEPLREIFHLPTPDLSVTAPSVRTLDDIISSQPETSESLSEKAPIIPPKSPQNAPTPPQPLIVLPRIQVARRTPSTIAQSFSISSSTTVGTSMFEGISEGERLCPDNVIPGLYSEGEIPLSEGQAVRSIVEDNEENEIEYHKKLLQNIIASKNQVEDGTSIASATLKDTEDLDEDTLQEVSISEGELLLLDDSPIAKLLNQMRTPPNIDVHASILTRTEQQNISEGEISKGEDVVNHERSAMVPLEQRDAKDISSGFPRKISSGGEIADTESNNNNGLFPDSLSVGEMRMLTDGKKIVNVSSPVAPKGASRVVKSEESALKPTQPSLENESLEEQDTLDNQSSNIDQSMDIFEKGHNTILVQSGNFGTTSTFNFTDSLNEPRINVVNEQKIGGVMDGRSVDEQRSEISENEIAKEDVPQSRPSSDKQPTKITLMIPSVADEDSSDGMTIEGGEHSNDDLSEISL